jgi:hypothetical protein
MKVTRISSFICAMSMLLASLLLPGCKPLIAVYDQYAYTQVTSVKVDALNLIDKATDNFSEHAAEVEAVNVKIEKAYEYEKHRPKNGITVKMWEILKSADKNLYGGVIKRWKAESKLGRGFITEIKAQISEGFDLIAELESQKIKDNDPKVTNFLSK